MTNHEGKRAGAIESAVRPEIHEYAPGENPITAYYLRHGESSEDKTDPLRGLTEKGIAQVEEAIRRVAGEIKDKNAEIRLFDSGSERTKQQCIVAARVLKDAGFSNLVMDMASLPQKRAEVSEGGVRFGSVLEGDALTRGHAELAERLGFKPGWSIKELIAELRATPEYMKKIRTLEKETGISAVVAWLMDKEIPEGVETPEQKARMIEEAIARAAQLAEGMREIKSRPVVALVFGHASALTSYGTKAFALDPSKAGEVENAEGVKVGFSGIAEQASKVEPFGQEIEKMVGVQ